MVMSFTFDGRLFLKFYMLGMQTANLLRWMSVILPVHRNMPLFNVDNG